MNTQAQQPKELVAVRPPAGPARLRRRHRGLLWSFVLLVLLPSTAISIYLWIVAEDRYGSVTGFTVRQEETGGATEILGGLTALTGSSLSSDGDILYEFILSQTMVREVETRLGLRAHFAAQWRRDPLFALWPSASIEDLEWFWRRILRISYDQRSGLIEVQVVAYSADMAQAIAREILRQSQEMINRLNERARADAMRYAETDLEEAVARLKTAREALTSFRTRTQIVDPAADIQGRMGVINNLQQQLAQALISYDILDQNTTANDPRKLQTAREIEVIRERIAREREGFATETAGVSGEDYPRLIAEYEALQVDREFAEETYRAALAALDVARAKASRQSRYLATYIAPTLAETSAYPNRLLIELLSGLFLVLSWAVMVLVYYAIRDRD
ncbi:sugar transporter [Roseovarius sp. MBR-6]|uniref:sugar transporter n=1 Tax=Roseovarius sp. MBR-6 TaxID=3156459 RepID=UPI003393BDF6